MNNVPPGLSLVAENDHLVLKRDCVLEVQYHLDEQTYLSKFETMGLPYQHDLLKQSGRKVMAKDLMFRPDDDEKKPMYPIPHPPKYSNSSEKPYQCNTCKKTFSQQSNLCKHQLIHFGVKPYGCDTCGKRFTQQANLIKHKRIHTGDKPFTCKVCQRQFSQNANLKKHMQLHTGEKRYRCEFCDKAFVQQANLERHRRTHTGEKPFSCEVCQKKFTQKGNLVKHEVIHYLKDNSRLASQFQTKVPSKEVLHNLIHVADLPSQSTSNDGYHKKMGAPVIVSAREGMFVKRF